MKNFIVILLSVCSFTTIISQEICNDALDNDGDGLIDLNDDDCTCEDLLPQSLIPNPSFEEMSCCPQDGSRLDCADSWIQASLATTDYMHTCGITSPWWLGYTTPMPFPDGEGAIGFRDGRRDQPNFKEYTGSRLIRPLEADVEYRLDLFVGFHSDPSSETFTFSIFGGRENNSIPFGQGNENFGCPTNGSDFVELGSLEISGKDEWINVIFEFTPTEDFPVLVIGPGCAGNPNYMQEPYFYFDRITIAEKSEFEVPFTDIIGDICDEEIILFLEDEATSIYQWYLDGIALVGQVASSLELTPNDAQGNYSVLVTTTSGCFLSESFDLKGGDVTTTALVEICEGEFIVINGQSASVSGIYEEIISISNICDSITYIDLVVYPKIQVERFDTICDGDDFIFEDLNASIKGDYVVLGETDRGCEMTTTIHLHVSDNVDFLELGADIEIALGDFVNLEPLSISPNAHLFSWTDAEGNTISSQLTTGDFQPFNDQYYYFNTFTEGDCGLKDSVFVRVSEEIEVYIPNVFTPASNDANSEFTIGYNNAVQNITAYRIYDRWGNLVYQDTGSINNFKAWDGYSSSGVLYEMGVYTYIIELELINANKLLFAGDVFLMK